MRKIRISDISYFVQGIMKGAALCPYCRQTPQVYATKYKVIDICLCQRCALFFVNPMYVSSRGIAGFYDAPYDAYGYDATHLPGPDELQLLKTSNFKDWTTKNLNKNDRLSVIRRLARGNRLLEFGSSWGYFIFQARAHGFEPVVGVEISEKRRRFGQVHLGVRILPDIQSVSGEFDIIYSAHVLEHLLSLEGVFDRFHAKLAPGGSLILEVPNFDPDMRGADIRSIIGKVHPLGFCRKFFERNLQKHGFSEVTVAGSYDDLVSENSAGRPLGANLMIHAKKQG